MTERGADCEIRGFEPADADAVVALWEACGLTRPWNDPRADIARKLSVQPELFLVAEEREDRADPELTARGGDDAVDRGTGGRIVGSVMAGYDGHRGWLYSLASAPERRGEGIGRALVAEAERRLAAIGCPKVQLMVRSENDAVIAFYDGLGYETSDVIVTGKRLIRD